MFFAFDGLDGVGKTTQLELFCQWLSDHGHEVEHCIDPGSTPLGEKVRSVLLERHGTTIDPMAEMLLFMAARAQLVAEVILPALEAGRTVVSDRYLLANVVYQGYARGLDVKTIWEIGRVATGGVAPDLTVVLDMPIDATADRLARPLDRMETGQDDAFRQRLRSGFLAEAIARPDTIAIIDAARPIDVVQAEIRRRAEPVLARAAAGRLKAEQLEPRIE
ncbi:MAG TPA: dTMP kinase [Pirellulales bacterium]|jgi:dTMP kinase|nr:dTMP kinase [Pirellulales bacterium]